MRAKALLPIIALLLILLLVLGFAVARHASTTIQRLIDNQLDVSLKLVQNQLSKQEAIGLGTLDYQKAVEGEGVGSDGGVFVVGEDGRIIADSAGMMLNQSVADEAWLALARGSALAPFEASFGQNSIYAHAWLSNDKLIISYLPTSELDDYLKTPLYLVGVLGFVMLVIVVFLIYFLLSRLLIDPVESFADQTRTLRQGDAIELRPLRGCKELVAAAHNINKLITAPPKVAPVKAAAKSANTKLAATLARAAEKRPVAAVSAPASASPSPTASGQVQTLFISTNPATVQVVVFKDLVRAAVEPIRSLISQKQLKFSLLVDNRIPEQLWADPDQVLQKLQELFLAVASAANPQDKLQGSVTLVAPPTATPMLLGADSLPKQPLSLKFSVKRGYQARTLVWTVYRA